MITIDFVEYFNSFYGKDGLYPCRDVTAHEIAAIVEHLPNFTGDSWDRERVRDIIFSERDQAYMYGDKGVQACEN